MHISLEKKLPAAVMPRQMDSCRKILRKGRRNCNTIPRKLFRAIAPMQRVFFIGIRNLPMAAMLRHLQNSESVMRQESAVNKVGFGLSFGCVKQDERMVSEGRSRTERLWHRHITVLKELQQYLA